MLDCFQFEVDPNCIEKVLVELIVSVSEQQTRFPDATIADQQHFEQIITMESKEG